VLWTTGDDFVFSSLMTWPNADRTDRTPFRGLQH